MKPIKSRQRTMLSPGCSAAQRKPLWVQPLGDEPAPCGHSPSPLPWGAKLPGQGTAVSSPGSAREGQQCGLVPAAAVGELPVLQIQYMPLILFSAWKAASLAKISMLLPSILKYGVLLEPRLLLCLQKWRLLIATVLKEHQFPTAR